MVQPNRTMDSWLLVHQLHSQTEAICKKELKKEHDLTLNEFFVLMYFYNTSDDQIVRIQDLIDFVGLSQSAMSRLITNMGSKKCGVIKEQNIHGDRRDVLLSMTDSGIEKYEAALKLVERLISDIYKEYDIDHEALFDLLKPKS